MELIDWPLQAGINNKWYGQGKFFRITAGTGNITIEVGYADGSSQKSRMLTGIGVDLRHPDTGAPYVWVDFVSATAQTIQFLATSMPTTDSRMVGDVNLNGTMNVINQVAGNRSLSGAGGVAYTAAGATQILPVDAQRLKTAMTFNTDVYIGFDATVTNANGFLWPAGQIWVDENQGALWVYSASAGAAKFLQDRK